jgi:hypothetical protein
MSADQPKPEQATQVERLIEALDRLRLGAEGGYPSAWTSLLWQNRHFKNAPSASPSSKRLDEGARES